MAVDSKGAWGVLLKLGLEPYEKLNETHPHVVDRLMEMYDGPVMIRPDGQGAILRRRRKEPWGYYWQVRKSLGVELEKLCIQMSVDLFDITTTDGQVINQGCLCASYVAQKTVCWNHVRSSMPLLDPTDLGDLSGFISSCWGPVGIYEVYHIQRMWRALPPHKRKGAELGYSRTNLGYYLKGKGFDLNGQGHSIEGLANAVERWFNKL